MTCCALVEMLPRSLRSSYAQIATPGRDRAPARTATPPDDRRRGMPQVCVLEHRARNFPRRLAREHLDELVGKKRRKLVVLRRDGQLGEPSVCGRLVSVQAFAPAVKVSDVVAIRVIGREISERAPHARAVALGEGMTSDRDRVLARAIADADGHAW